MIYLKFLIGCFTCLTANIALAGQSGSALKLSTQISSVATFSQTRYVVPQHGTWQIRRADKRLDVALQRWGKSAGYAIQWDADKYLLVEADTLFEGSFEQAVTTLLQSPGIRYSEYPLEACLYDNSPPLLRITRLGDQSENCK